MPVLPCIECGKQPELVRGERIYPHRSDLRDRPFWLCEPCNAYVGCHVGTTNPLGRPAGPETRGARSAAHRVFDPLWRNGRMSRTQAYRWLREAMGLTKEECHIGMMNAEQARQALRIVLQNFHGDPVYRRPINRSIWNR